MVGPTPRILKDERVRFETIREYCGCLPCLLMGHPDRHTTIEHVTKYGRRVGVGSMQHANTIGLCLWHHFKVCDPGNQQKDMTVWYGPSLANGRHLFEAHFGDESHVLIPTQDFLLAQFAEEPWPAYTISRKAARLTRSEWIRLNHAHSANSQ